MLSIIVLWLGMYPTKRIEILNEFNIPIPVVGGLIGGLIVALSDVLVDTKVNL